MELVFASRCGAREGGSNGRKLRNVAPPPSHSRQTTSSEISHDFVTLTVKISNVRVHGCGLATNETKLLHAARVDLDNHTSFDQMSAPENTTRDVAVTHIKKSGQQTRCIHQKDHQTRSEIRFFH